MPQHASPGTLAPAQLHPALWRGSQLPTFSHACVPTGHAVLSAELPGAGWPLGQLTELLVARAGIGEIRLLLPALQAHAPQRRIALLQPGPMPCPTAWGPAAHRLLWLRPTREADAPWAAEQVLKNGSCAALLYWQDALPTAALRRLHLAAQTTDLLFFMIRSPAAAARPSPAPLRILLQPAPHGVQATLLKRRGPQHEGALAIALDTWPVRPAPTPGVRHEPVDGRAPALADPRRAVSPVVG